MKIDAKADGFWSPQLYLTPFFRESSLVGFKHDSSFKFQA